MTKLAEIMSQKANEVNDSFINGEPFQKIKNTVVQYITDQSNSGKYSVNICLAQFSRFGQFFDGGVASSDIVMLECQRKKLIQYLKDEGFYIKESKPLLISWEK